MSTSLTDLLTMTRDYLDESSADRWTQAELRRYINQGIAYVQGQIIASNPDYFLRVETATAAGGTYELALPTDIFGTKLRSIQYYDNSTVATGKAYRLQPGTLEWVYANMDYSGLPQEYALHAGFIRFAPILENTTCFRFVYSMKESAFATDGSDDSNNLGQIADEHADVIAMYAAITAKNKVGADSRPLAGFLSTRLEQILYEVHPTDPFIIPQTDIDGA